MGKKPTIAELEAILDGPPCNIQMHPDGSLTVAKDGHAMTDELGRIRVHVRAAHILYGGKQTASAAHLADADRMLTDLICGVPPVASATLLDIATRQDPKELLAGVLPRDELTTTFGETDNDTQ